MKICKVPTVPNFLNITAPVFLGKGSTNDVPAPISVVTASNLELGRGTKLFTQMNHRDVKCLNFNEIHNVAALMTSELDHDHYYFVIHYKGHGSPLINAADNFKCMLP